MSYSKMLLKIINGRVSTPGSFPRDLSSTANGMCPGRVLYSVEWKKSFISFLLLVRMSVDA